MGRIAQTGAAGLACLLATLTACTGRQFPGPEAQIPRFQTPLAKAETPYWMTCPEVLGPAAQSDIADDPFTRLRAERPAAGGAEDPALYASVRFLPAAYAMAEAFDRGRTPEAAFPADALILKALVLGKPGRDTERRRRARRSRTLYGFWARDLQTDTDLIVLRGTLRPGAWARSVEASQIPYPDADNGAQVHKEFLDLHNALTFDRGTFKGSLATALQDGAFAGRRVTVTGHSLGGALAILIATELARSGQVTGTDLITVGAPRPGNGIFRGMNRAIDSAVRICNAPDLVPMLPPSTEDITYVHVGEARPYSSFDYADTLINGVSRNNTQVECWHSIDAHAWMLDHSHKGRGDRACWK